VTITMNSMTTIPVTMIAVADIVDSPFNPRKRYNEAGLAELAADIKAQGILQPLVVRARNNSALAAHHAKLEPSTELVFGHRRLRAARAAGLTEVPCILSDMGDEEARRAQIGENLQREDVHPIEEAEGLEALMNQHGVTVEQLVTDTGKSRSYIYGRLKLLQAVPEVRDACLAGDVGSEVALLVARLRTPDLQRKALAAIKKEWRAKLDDGGKASYRAIRDLLAEKFTLDLPKAIFPINDASLIPPGFPEAVPCEICPKRSGNAPEYADLALASSREPSIEDFPDTEEGGEAFAQARRAWDAADSATVRLSYSREAGPDLCTDPDCFEAKKKAHLARLADALKEEGKTVITGTKARAALDQHGKLKPDYVPLAKAKAALKAAGVKQAPQTVTILDQRNGKHVYAVARTDLKAAGAKIADKPKSHNENYAEQNARWERERKARELKEKVEDQWRTAAWLAIHDAAKAAARNTVELQVAATALLDRANWWNIGKLMGNAWGVKGEAELAKRIGSMTADECTRLLIDLAGAAIATQTHDDAAGRDLAKIAKHYGIDVDALKAQAAQASAPAAGEKAKAKTKLKPTKRAAKVAQPEEAHA
jgi:ParB/RepB/Spo0J family partition protein